MNPDLFAATVDEWQNAIDSLIEPDEELKDILVKCQLAARTGNLTARADAIEELSELLVITRGNWGQAS